MDSENTQFINQSSKRKGKSDAAATVGVVGGAAAVGVAAGAGAHAVFAEGEDTVDVETQIEGADAARGMGAANQHEQAPREPQAARPARPAQPAENNPATDDNTPIVDNNDPVENPVGNPGGQTPDNTGRQPENTDHEEPVVPVDVTDEDVDPDEIIAATEIDQQDMNPESEAFMFDELSTVYTVDGQELTAASFHMEDGFEGVMVDVDGDGVFDDVAVESDGQLVGIAEAPGFTVDDVELQLNPDSGYMAQDDSVDHTSVPDDTYMDDIYDSSMA